MIEQNRFIMIGATSRNVGKTEFACQLIQQVAQTQAVLGVKVTTVAERDGQCPRGGQGCGVCSSLADAYCITEETSPPPEKDTARLLQAGAESVFWLRVLKDHLAEGMEALLEQMPAHLPVVCESNSARLVLAPSVFVVVRPRQDDVVKPSCEAVMDQADVVVTYDGMGWDTQPNRCVWTENQWLFKKRSL
ncbi:MAG: hypothetical protein HQ515_10335 [Phycisphaeraceae bacterium]|nr:hypothetical protein [Phycisphaeraceae bacterium]